MTDHDPPRGDSLAATRPESSQLSSPARRVLGERHEQDLEFLARSATEWVGLPPDEDILAFAGRRIFELVGETFVAVSEFDPTTRRVRCRAAFGSPAIMAQWRALAPSPVGAEALVSDEAYAGLALGRLVVVPGGLDTVTLGLIPSTVAPALEAAIGFRQAVAMGFALRQELFGSLIIVGCHGIELPDPRIVEAFVNQATVALQRRRAEEALRESERRFRELADQLPQSIMEFDRQGRVTFANRHVLVQSGLDAASHAAAVYLLDGVDPGDHDRARADFERVLRGESVLGVEYTGRRQDGSTYEFASYVSPVVRDGQVVGGRGIGIDVTEQKRAERERLQLEAQLRHADKLESLAVLAGGLAHDYNNLLVAILGNAELALTGLKPGTVAHERVNKIQRAARRAAELTNQLLDYSGRRHFALQALALNDLVREAASRLEGPLGRAGAVRLDLLAELPPIEADPIQVQQVLTNLLTNAADAIEGRVGAVTVRTSIVRGDDPSLRDAYLGAELAAGPHACLDVSDTGCGMDEATRVRVFDPFFTTKFPGRGLGLAAVLGIVRAHRGAMQVVSAVDRGTTFRVLFRLARAVADGNGA